MPKQFTTVNYVKMHMVPQNKSQMSELNLLKNNIV